MRDAVWCAIIPRACSSTPRRSTAAPAAAIGSTSASVGAPRNTSAISQPSATKRAMPTNDARSPTATVAAMRPRTPRINAHRRRSKYTSGPPWSDAEGVRPRRAGVGRRRAARTWPS